MNKNLKNPWLHHNMIALILIERIGTAEDVDWRAEFVKGAAMGLKKFIYRTTPKP